MHGLVGFIYFLQKMKNNCFDKKRHAPKMSHGSPQPKHLVYLCYALTIPAHDINLLWIPFSILGIWSNIFSVEVTVDSMWIIIPGVEKNTQDRVVSLNSILLICLHSSLSIEYRSQSLWIKQNP